MIHEHSCLDDLPLLALLPQDACEAVAFENEKAAVRGHSEDVFREEYGVSRAVDIEPVRLAILPLAVDVLRMG
jgi:hypothetical protein